MGERKGQNLYYPPDYDPRVGGLNKFHGTHALRERARKLSQGILIIRFELPYNIWCDGCGNHVGMGVRYNAEKKKVGMYYTTPVYQFRMKCHLCDSHFEIKTDPGNLDYLIVSGARRQENRWDPTQNEQVVPETKETQKRLFDDPMFKLEHTSGDAQTAKDAKPRIGKLVARNDSVWRDNYEVNSLLRKQFRTKSKELQVAKQSDQALLNKSSLEIQLLPETAEDRHAASLLSLEPAFTIDEKQTSIRNNIINSNILPSSSGLITSFGGLKREKLLSQSKQLTRSYLGIAIKATSAVKPAETCVRMICDTNAVDKGTSVKENGKVFGKEVNVKENETLKVDGKEVNVKENETLKVDGKEVNVKENETLKVDGKEVNVKENETLKVDSKEVNVKENETLKVDGKEVNVKENETLKVDGKEVNVKENETLKVDGKEVNVKENETLKVDGKEVNVQENETKKDCVKRISEPINSLGCTEAVLQNSCEIKFENKVNLDETVDIKDKSNLSDSNDLNLKTVEDHSVKNDVFNETKPPINKNISGEADIVAVKRKRSDEFNDDVIVKKPFMLCDYDSTSGDSDS